MRMRYSLTYRAKSGRPVTLYNLAAEGCAFIQRAQEGLGSTEFQRTEQPHEYGQAELDALRKTEGRHCNRCGRPMLGATAYDGACACGGFITGALQK